MFPPGLFVLTARAQIHAPFLQPTRKARYGTSVEDLTNKAEKRPAIYYFRPIRSLIRFLDAGNEVFYVAPVSEPMSQKSEAAALRLVVEGTVSETGTEFFRALVKNLAEAMGTVGAWVTEYLPEQKRLRAQAFWLKDRFVENFDTIQPAHPAPP